MDTKSSSPKLLFKDIKSRLGSDDWTVREKAVKEVGGLFVKVHDIERVDKTMLEKVFELAKDEKWEVRKAAVTALYNSKSPRVIDVLTGMANDSNSHVKEAAKRSLKRIENGQAVVKTKRSRKFVEIKNNYVVGPPIRSKKLFFGRDDAFQFLSENLQRKEQKNILIIQGERRVGKTSILLHLENRLSSENMIFGILDLQSFGPVDTSGFFHGIISGIQETLKAKELPVVNMEKKGLSNHDPYQTTQLYFNELERQLGDRNLAIFFDEIELLWEKLEDGKIEPEVFDFMRSLINQHPSIAFGFTATHRLRHMREHYGSPIFSMMLYKKIDYLDEDSAERLICEPVKAEFEYDALTVNTIKKVTSNHPFFIQLVCKELIDYVNRKRQRVFKPQEMDKVLNLAMERGELQFFSLLRESRFLEKIILAVIAEITESDSAEIPEADILKRIQTRVDVSDQDIQNGLDSLKEREILKAEYKDVVYYSYKVALVRRWVKKNFPLLRVIREMKPR